VKLTRERSDGTRSEDVEGSSHLQIGPRREATQ
jgi:hypothetical protein